MNPKDAAVKITRPFTPVPNEFIDKVMPTLKDTEWRLLCVIARQTIGWSDGKGKRKERDWLTQSQLMARTGRNSAALSAAVDALIRHRLVDAFDASGNLLLTPQERRRHRGPVFYGLCRKETQEHLPPAKSELQKANTTKETRDKRKINKEGANQNLGSQRGVTIHRGWVKAHQLAAERYFGHEENSALHSP